ncbi:meiotically up-regulated gene 137 protein [Lipomyces starkeyi]
MMTKKIDRLRQWTSEKLGNEQKTQESEDFRELEYEITMRYEGTERLHQSMALYVRNLSKRRELDELEKTSPIDILGQAMAIYGDEFVADSTYGQALYRLGVANQKLARHQEIFVERINKNFLEGIEKSIAQFKDCQAARKKLEYRRLAYDTALSKVQKTKREDARLEEEVRAQRIKYEEAGEDVVRKMNSIRDAESDNLADLVDFFEAECEYYERCNEVLVNLRKNWVSDLPGGSPSTPKGARSRSTSIKSFGNSHEEISPPRRPNFKSGASSSSSIQSSSSNGYDSAPKFGGLRNQTTSADIGSTLDTLPTSTTLSISSGKLSSSANIGPPRLSRSVTEPPPLPGPRPSLGPKKKLVKANFRYQAEAEDELSLEPGDVIIVTEEVDAGWWIGELVGGERSGLFPVPYCTVISEGSANGGPAKPAKPAPVMRKVSTLNGDTEQFEDERGAMSSPAFQSSMKKLNGGVGRLGPGISAKKPPPPPPKRSGVIGAIGAR